MGIKFGGWAPNYHCKNIREFKFGSLVRDRKGSPYVYYNTMQVRNTAKFNSPPTFLAMLYSTIDREIFAVKKFSPVA